MHRVIHTHQPPPSNPGCANSQVALNAVLSDARYPEELWAALGKPVALGAVEELIEAAALVDPSFQKQVQTIWETGACVVLWLHGPCVVCMGPVLVGWVPEHS